MSSLAFEPLCEFQMSIHTIAISDLDEALMMCGLVASEMSLNKSLFLR